MAGLQSVSFTNPEQGQVLEIERRQALAKALQAQSQEPIQNQTAGGWQVPINPLQGAAKLAQAYVGNMQQDRAQQLAQALGQQSQNRRSADTSMLANALQGRKATPGGLTEDASGNVTQADPMGAKTPVQSIGQALPMMGSEMQPVALNAMMGAQTREDTQNFQRSQTQAQQAAHLHERELAIQAQNERARQQQQWQDQQARQAAQDRQGLAQMVGGMKQEQPQIITTPNGVFAIDRPGASARPVLDPDGQQLQGKTTEKALPTSAAQKLFENQQNLRRAQQALTLIEGNNVGPATGDTAATGLKGYLPDALLQRVDPSGVDTRAAISDLGSLIIHDRSGAAVTAAEYPRLRPFIPQHTDNPDTVKKKLGRFVSEYQKVVQEMGDFYKESGYKVPTETLQPAVSPSQPDRRQATRQSGTRVVDW